MIETRPAEECELDIVALGEVMLRLDPGEGRIRTARRFEAWEGGGEYNVARGMRKVFGLRAGVVVDGENEIVIEYSSALSNVQLDRGIVPVQTPRVARNNPWWRNDQKYLSFGPQQAKLVPFVDVEYPTPTTTTTTTTTPTVTPTPTPTPAVDKVAPRIATKVVKPVEVNTTRRLRVTVRAADIVPSGSVKIRVKGAGERKTYTQTLNVRGRTKVWLPKFARTGKVVVVVKYLGDDFVEAKNKRIAFKVVQRRTVR